MVTVLLASNPIHGHVGPILQVAAHLVRSGHRVAVLTGTRFRERVASIGAEFRALGGVADYDDRRPDLYLPEREKYRGLKQAQYDIARSSSSPSPTSTRRCRRRSTPCVPTPSSSTARSAASCPFWTGMPTARRSSRSGSRRCRSRRATWDRTAWRFPPPATRPIARDTRC
ncbi:hypothetical protein M3672_03750 [Microbacterium enclense]|uniref:hypothetical protein n=1 Tax=Microbacterium enclense TaxID=993073 RepID=UPI00203F0C56|nr:hypothetical protein [Microbacterium enclense]MCM3613549.1 hypothetical protein [Microbacterium enclense]